MPNWIEGTFRVKGSKENIERFILGALKASDDREGGVIRDDEMFFVNESGGSLWLVDSSRQFLDEEYIEPFKTKDGKYIFSCRYRGAWGIDRERIVALSEEYGVRIKVNGYERGTQYEEMLDVDNGKIVGQRKIEYEEYEEWVWNCDMPNMGG